MSTVFVDPDSQVPPVYVSAPWPRRPATPPPTLAPLLNQNAGLPVCMVRAIVNDSVDGAPVMGARIEYKLSSYDVDDGYVAPLPVEVTTDVFGEAFVNLWPNELGAVETVYNVKIVANGKTLRVTAAVPNVPEADLHLIAQLPPWPGESQGSFISGEVYGWMVRAEEAAQAAEASEAAAKTSEINAGISEDAADADAKQARELAPHAGAAPPAATPETALVPGRKWFNTTNGKEYIFYDDGTSQQWVEAAGFYYVEIPA